ncbi:uncharacterized protein LOC142624234 [Castanea sativa]|uniref:uncharacterized protein LOC142624234 n=1 Tax=Castanea sativa TaxID=21020 RepID=UPI003F64DA42
METKLGKDEIKKVQQEIGWSYGIVVPSTARGGGLAILWKSDLAVTLRVQNKWYIDVLIDSRRSDIPWVCIGDFNEVLSVTEKEGGVGRACRQIENFRECLKDTGLRDLRYTGSWFTWAGERRGYGCIWERIDRALGTIEWRNKFLQARLFHIANLASDHCVLLLRLDQCARQADKRVKLFHFEAMWLKHEQCEEVVKEAWETGLQSGRVNPIESCLEGCRIALTKWYSQVFGHVGKKLKQVQRKLQTLETHAIGLANKDQISETRRELNKLYAMEEDMWFQRARSNWAKSGDKNTRYFHEKASSRKKKNTILGLMDESNQWQEDLELIKGIAINYYKKLFSSANTII